MEMEDGGMEDRGRQITTGKPQWWGLEFKFGWSGKAPGKLPFEQRRD